MSYRDWYVGMKVVCVDDGPAWSSLQGPKPSGLEAGRIYTIKRIGTELRAVSPRGRKTKGAVVVDVGVPHPCYIKGFINGFGAYRFRPLVARKTDISALTALLHTNKLKEDA